MSEKAKNAALLQRAERLRRLSVFANVLFYTCVALSVLALVGVVVVVLVHELGSGLENTLLFALVGGFAGGALLFALLAFVLGRVLLVLYERRADALERSDGEESFFVGEETLATFGETSLLLHAFDGKGKKINVPYEELRLFSVCNRRAPKERGEWSVLFEIPARYLSKEKKGEAAPPVLVQAEGKERLYAAIAAHTLPLLGEPHGENKGKKGKFCRTAKYTLPHGEKRRRALIFALVGGAVAVAGAVTAIWQVTVGSFIFVIGGAVALRSVMNFAGAKGVLALYKEGLYWKDGVDRIFLKWEEIERVELAGGDAPLLRAVCPYGEYELPALGDAYAQISRLAPEKCGGEHGENA